MSTPSNDITLIPYNEIYYKIQADRGLMVALRDAFSLRAPGFIFNPLYKNGLWNGYVPLFKGDLFPIGLVEDLKKLGEANNWNIFLPRDYHITPISIERLNEVLQETLLSDIDKNTKAIREIHLRY